MFFLIRVAFWLSIVVLLLPTGTPPAGTPQVGALEALSAAGAAVADMRQFCSRQPEACVVGSQASTAFGQKAQASAKMLYDYITERSASDETGATPGKTAATSQSKLLQGTLTASDRAPAWHDPTRRTEQMAKSAS